MAAAAEAGGGGAPVTLHLYDLTQGMASALSPMLLGKHIAGIWHSGLVVHGREYFFGYGISSTPAGQTPFGQPDMAIGLGTTEVPPDMVADLIADLRPRFTPGHYNLINHNCNHFTSELSQLLTGEDIPDFVRTQAQEVMETPLGRQFAPLIMQLEGITSQAHAAGFGAAAAAPAAAPAASPSGSGGGGGGPPAAAGAAAAARDAAGREAARAAAAGAVAAAAAEQADAMVEVAPAEAGPRAGAGGPAGGLAKGVEELSIGDDASGGGGGGTGGGGAAKSGA